MLCMKMKEEFCFSCFILSFIGLVLIDLCFLTGLFLHKIIEHKKINEERILSKSILCYFMSLILAFINMMEDCQVNFENFYYLIFNIFGLQFLIVFVSR